MTFKPYPHARGDGSLGDGLAMLRARVARRMALGLFSERISIGFGRDMSVAVEPPAARIPVRLREFQPDDLPALFFDEFRHFFGIALFFRKIVQGYVGSFACVGNSRRPAYARISPCDQGFSATEPVAAMVALFPGIRHGFHFGLQAGGFLLLFFISFLAEFAARVLYFINVFCVHFIISYILGRS